MLWNQVFDIVLGVGVIILQIAILELIVLHIANRMGYFRTTGAWLGKNGTPIAFVLSLLATIGSLIYSNVLGFEPCLFCWWQRIFMFPQVFILGIATFTREWQSIKKYAIALSIVGSLFSIYHYLIQNISAIASTAPCSAVGQTVSCSVDFVKVFGYITIPMMCLTMFMAIILVLSFKERN